MKKFTRNFLFVEHGFGNVLRKIGLSMVAILLAVTSFGQMLPSGDAQDTYHVFAEIIEDCYRYDNDYEVAIKMRDFVEIDSFGLVLEYDETVFKYEPSKLEVIEGQLSGLTVTSVSQAGEDKLVMVWDSGDNPQTIEPNNDTLTMFTLHFSLVDFQHADEYPVNIFSTDLTWSNESSVWNDTNQDEEILTWYVDGGSITAVQEWTDILVDVTAADCDGGNAIATVVTPANEAGMEYSFNSDNDFQSESWTSLVAPSTGHTVEVRLGDCVSWEETFDVDAADPFSYAVQEEVTVRCPGGQGDIEFTIPEGAGTPPYAYYIIPMDEWSNVLSDIDALSNPDAAEYLDEENYNTGNRINQLAVGTYMAVAVDANLCNIDLDDENDWTEVTVNDNPNTWSTSVTSLVDEQCYDFANGEFSFYVEGGTPWSDGYKVWMDDVEMAGRTDSIVKVEMAPGTYDFTFVDSLQCQYETSIEILPADEIEFDVNHTDASCGENTGSVWIDVASIEGSTGSVASHYWVLSTTTDFSVADTLYDVTAIADSLPADVYYVRLVDSVGCYADFRYPTEDNAIKVLSIEYEIENTEILCAGDSSDVTITLTSIPGTDEGIYLYAEGDTTDAWQTSNEFLNLAGDSTYTFWIKDTVENCVISEEYPIDAPDSLKIQVVDLKTLPPTCHAYNDGNIQVRPMTGYEGTPFADFNYQYKIDDKAWDTGGISNSFAADTGWHTVYIKDANGCVDSADVYLWLTPNVIDVNPEGYTVGGEVGQEVWIDVDRDTLLCYGDSTYLEADTLSWIHEPANSPQGDREPVIYYTDAPYTSVDEITTEWTDTTLFGAGTYYFVGKDEWGCPSNVDTFVIVQPEPLVAEAEVIAQAGCEGSNSGVIMIEAWNGFNPGGNPHGPDTTEFSRYQYTLTQSEAILAQSDWYDQLSWSDFQNDDPDNDSVVYIRNLPKGEYWIGVREYCGIHGRTDLIWRSEMLVIDGADAIDVDWLDVTIDTVVCNVSGEKPDMNGAITGLLGATTEGFGGYTFTIDLIEEYERYDEDDLPTFPMSNETGDFTGLPAGEYLLTVTDSVGCEYTEYFDIPINDLFWLQTEIAYASCNGVHDGIIRYIVSGGVGPFEETTNNVGTYEDPMNIPDNRWYDRTSREYDRRVRAGIYETYIRDLKGCIYGPVIDTILQPAELELTVVNTAEPSCADGDGQYDDGQIWVMPSGGWNSDTDDFEYHVTLGTTTYVVDLGDTVKFMGLEASNHTITVQEHNSDSDFEDVPLTTISDYFDNWGDGDYDDQLPYQNSESLCLGSIVVDLQGPDPIVYDTILWYDEMCYNTPTGQIDLQGITGGTAPYTVWVEGPLTYRPLNDGIGEMIELDEGSVNYTWDDLVRGHYTVFIKDANDCQIVKESGEIERPDTLKITNTELIENALCNDSNGIVEIHATGGTQPYTYWLVEFDEGIAVDTIPEQVGDPIFYVPAGEYVAYVEDANGCDVGGPSRGDGTPIMEHRVAVLEPQPVDIENWWQEEATCYGSDDGEIHITEIMGGNGPTWTVEVTGTTYDGQDVYEIYENVSTTNALLDGLYASTDKDVEDDDWTSDDFYTITIYDSEGCMFVETEAYVLHPDKIIVELRDKNDAFICPNDLAGLYEIYAEGGTPYSGSNNYKFKWQAWKLSAEYTAMQEARQENGEGQIPLDSIPADEKELVDSLTGDWGFTNEYLGYAGLHYQVWAQDANECETSTDTFIVAPKPVEFEVDKISCYGDTMASARVMVTGTEGRSFQVWYKQIEGDHAALGWMTDSVWFTGSHDMIQEFIFDDDDLTDSRYVFQIVDTLGCASEYDTLAFDPVQNPLVLDVEMGDEGECTSEVVLGATGGMPPYEFHIMSDTDTMVVAEGVQMLAAGAYDIKVVDSNFRCYDMEAGIVVETNPVVRDTMIETFIGYETQFVDTEAGVDVMLAEGDTTFTYMFEGCERTLNVEVVAVPRDAAIAVVQSEADSSDWIGDIVKVTGTVTAVVEGEGFFMQDAAAAWSGIYVASTDADVVIGDDVVVVGEVAEVDMVTTIMATSVTMDETKDGHLITPVVAASPSAIEDEMWESVLVTVEGARAMAEDTTAGTWVIYTEASDDAVVHDWLYAYGPTEGNFYDVTGVVNGMDDAYTLEPRMEADVVDLSDPAVSVDPNLELVEFKVYPNPFNDHIKIDNNDKLTRVVISNVAGQRVMDLEYPSHEIRTAKLVSGVYVVSLFTEDGLAKTERIIKR